MGTLELTNGEVKEMIRDEAMREEFIERMIDQYNQQILWLAYSYVKDYSLAEEITQDVFLTCYHKIDTFRHDSSIRTWLYRITVNKCKDCLRKKKIRAFLTFENQKQENLVIEEAHPESIAFQTMEDQLLSERVLSLPTKFKEVIFMHYFEEMKIQEIADVLGAKVNTVKTRLKRGRAMLKSMYEEGSE